MMRKFYFLLLFFFLFSTAKSQNYYACGEQSGVWNYDTVFVHCNVLIPAGSQLEIAPGTQVLFTGHYSMFVEGVLKAIGQAGDTICFASADTTGFSDIHSTSGGWNGIRFENTAETSDSSLFAYCKFSYGKAVGDSLNCFGGAIRLRNFGKVSIRHSHIHHNYSFYWGGGLYAYKSNILVENSIISGNYAGNDGMVYGYGGGLCFVACDPIVQKNHFYGNSSTGVGGAASFEYSKPLVLDCYIHDNYSALGGGLCFLRSDPDQPVANLMIVNNEALFFGGGIANLTATTVMSNATIAYNHASMGGGYYCNDYAHAKLFNSILWGNTSDSQTGTQVWIWDVYSQPGFYHCLVEGGLLFFGGSPFSGEYIGNIENDPLFEGNGSYSLLPGSPAINAGMNDIGFFALPDTDFLGNNRLMYGTVDIGAIEYQGYTDVKAFENQNKKIRIVPNPANPNSVILFNAKSGGQHRIRLFAAGGKLISEKLITANVGVNQLAMHILLPDVFSVKGLCLLTICSEDEQFTEKFILQ